MARNIISTLNAPKPPPTYSQAVVAGGLIFVSGTSPYDVTLAVWWVALFRSSAANA